MDQQGMDLVVSKMSDQWVTDCYCRELLKVKAILHFRGKINLGQANRELLKRYRQELQQRRLIVPRLNFRVHSS
jgi:hypothetical protein